VSQKPGKSKMENIKYRCKYHCHNNWCNAHQEECSGVEGCNDYAPDENLIRGK
jgi:hypothetical protein